MPQDPAQNDPDPVLEAPLEAPQGIWRKWGEGIWITAYALLAIWLNVMTPPHPGQINLTILLLNWVVPHLLLIYVARHPAREYGLDFSHIRSQAVWTVYAYLLLVPVAILAATRSEFQEFYGFEQPDVGAFLAKEVIIYGVQFAAWEFLLRGFLLFGLARYFGLWAVILEEIIIFPLAHLGKPGLEVIASAYAGLVFSLAAYRSKSFLPAFLSHWWVAVTLDTTIFVKQWGWQPLVGFFTG